MAFTKALPRLAAAAFFLLGTSQGPPDRSSLIGLPRASDGGALFVHGNGLDNDEDVVEDDTDTSRSNGASFDGSKGASSDGLHQMDSKSPGSLRGRRNSPGNKPAAVGGINGIFHELMKSLSADDGKDSFVDQVVELDRLSKMLDRIFPPRLQTAPKYQGALECLNEELSRDVLSGPNKDRRDPKALQQAYNFLRNPPVMLKVPDVFVELRAAADSRLWDKNRKAAAEAYERLGEPVPAHLLLSADEVMAREAEEPRVREEELSDEEATARFRVINGWLQQQYRLRLYYRKRIGALKGNPQDFLITFDAGPDHVSVTIEDIEGLSFNAELDPEPVDDEEDANVGEAAQRSEL